jgi:hypothetical protein
MLLVVSEYLTIHTASSHNRLGCLSFIFGAVMLANMYHFWVCVYVVHILRLPFLSDLLLKPKKNESGSTKSVILLIL